MTENSEGIASEHKRNLLCTVLFFLRSQPNMQSFPTLKFIKIRKILVMTLFQFERKSQSLTWKVLRDHGVLLPGLHGKWLAG